MQYIDPTVSKRKFEFELNTFKENQERYRKRGIMLLEAKFPNIYLAFISNKLIPPPIVFVVRLNFENYDMEPISVRFVDPYTFQPLMSFGIEIIKKHNNTGELQNLVQQNKGKLPFVCIRGIYEYHRHDGHSGDSWFLYRKKGGMGTMGYIIDILYTHGLTAIDNYLLNGIVKISDLRNIVNNTKKSVGNAKIVMPYKTKNLLLNIDPDKIST